MDSTVKYGQELGPNLIKIAKKLLQNKELIMLLNNTDLEPLNKTLHPEEINGIEFLHKLVRVIPLISAEEQDEKSKIVILFSNGEVTTNLDDERIEVTILVYCPFTKWKITGENLRPYAIMSEIRKSLSDRRINGLGEITYESFHVSTISEEMASFEMTFYINAFD